MKSFIRVPSRYSLVLFVAAGLTGFGTRQATALPAEGDLKQCWYDTGTTPRCQYCEGPCQSGGVCCRIVVVEEPV
jgi:hypothetical protein